MSYVKVSYMGLGLFLKTEDNSGTTKREVR